MPEDPVFLSKYFDGLNLKRKTGRIYLRFRFHSKKQDQLFADMKNWASANGHNISECVIQTESSTNIGWLVYSSQFTDISFLKKYIWNEIGVEAGFKMGAITTTDIWSDQEQKVKTEWKNRKKALAVHVDSDHANEAVALIAKFFEPKRGINSLAYTNSMKDKFLFTRPEYTIPKDHKLRYKKLVNRQGVHANVSLRH